MSGRGVVILTEPARCEFADAGGLVQAILQVQQLNQAGLAASQAFCDHPAAAAKFVEAYTNAYPELQQRSLDLPPPAVLQSIVAEGRVVPLQPTASSESAKFGEASQLYPLYVLSLGAPDALMRVLQENRFAASDIQVVEIAALEDPSTETKTVAEAVAHNPITRPSWGSETSAETRPDHDNAFPSSELVPSDSVALATVDVDLDHIQLERTSEQGNRSVPDPELDTTPATFPPPVSPASDESANQGKTSGNVGQVGAPDQAIPAPYLGTAATETSATSPNPADLTGTGATSPEISLDDIATAVAADAETAPSDKEQSKSGDDLGSPPVASGEAAPEDPPEVAGDSPDTPGDPVADDSDDDLGSVEPPPAAHDQVAPIRAADPDHTTSVQDSNDTDGQSFSDPGEDVLYPPSSSFDRDTDDVIYPLPPGPAPTADLLNALCGGAEDCEVVDLEGTLDALLGDVTGPDEADVDLIRSPFAGFCTSNDGSEPEAPAPPPADGGGADGDSAQHEWAPVVHDLDI